ncbi:MAG: phosphoglycerate kinase [Patescibacteria group bacterium]
MISIKEAKLFDGIKVLVRLDLNVPIANGRITDDFRIRKSLPLINYLKGKKAKIIIISHIETKDDPTLKPVCEYLNNFGMDCIFEKNYKKALNNQNDIILLENLRKFEGEKKNDKKFAKELASLADIYVNEAFSVSHREHASICAITEFISSYAGFQFEEEIKHLSSAFNPPHPFLFILGGLKFETKLPLIEKFIEIADKIFVGGALANDFFKEQGKDIGKSIVSSENFDLGRFLKNEKLLLPKDNVIENDAIMDAGEKTIEMLKDEINKVKYILWNGPLGAYELGFKNGTIELAKLIANSSAKTIVGGGDTLASIAELGLEDKFTFVSTGGGAMLDFLAKGTLPGIEALSVDFNR